MVFTFVLTLRVVLLDTYFRNGLNRNAKKSRRVMTEMKIHRTANSMKILTLQELSMPGTLILISSFVKVAFISFTSFFLFFFFSEIRWSTCIVLPLKEQHQGIEKTSLAARFRDVHPSLLLFLHRLRSISIQDKVITILAVDRKQGINNIGGIPQGARRE